MVEGLSRSEIERFLEERGAEWRLDATNLDARFARNRVRWNVIPELVRMFNPNLVAAIARTTEILSDDNAALTAFVEDWFASHSEMQNGTYVLHTSALAAESVAIQRRVIRAALKRIQPQRPLNDVSFDQVEAALRWVLAVPIKVMTVFVPPMVTLFMLLPPSRLMV